MDSPTADLPQGEQMAYKRRLAELLLHHGRPQEALALIDKGLMMHKTDAELLHLQGKCLEALNNTPGAFASYMSALTVDPAHVPSLVALAAVYKSRGLLAEALSSYEMACELDANREGIKEAMAVVLTDMGTNLKLAGKLQEGTTKYQAAIATCPGYAPAYYNMGVVHSERREFHKALEYYNRAVELQPRYAHAHCNIGVIYKEWGQLERAVASYEQALAAAPNFSIVQTNIASTLTDLGTQLKMAGRVEEGITLYERALTYNPRYADALYNLGVAFGETGRQDRAVFMYEMATHFNPSCAEAFNNLGVIYKERDNLERAMECYMAALQIRPNFPQSLNNLGVVYTAQGKAREALALLQAAIQACPTYAEAYNNLGVLQRDVGAIKEALESYTRSVELAPESRNAGQNRLLALNYIYPGEEALVCAAHKEWGNVFQLQFTPLPCPIPPPPSERDAQRPLRVGYISPDLFTHSVSYFAEAPLRHHRTCRVQHIVYSCVPKPDSKTALLKAAVVAAGGQWRDATAMPERDLAELVREDRVDILVELTGHTANNRLGVMALKPAPVQVTWIGYPNSTGLAAVDYRITDAICDPLETKQTFVEELVRLPGCFLCYTPSVDAPPVSPAPAVANGFVTFGSFNNLAKITIDVIRVWADILKRVPRSRLVLKNKPFACESARAHFTNLLSQQGIEPWRVDLLPLQSKNLDHLAVYAIMDISLDPFPYAGTTTTCESLFMGVPCVTLAGNCHAHNVGVSLLTAVGLQHDWVAHTRGEYIQLAVRHASDVQPLAHLRAGLRQRMLDSPLCDAATFVPRLEDTYRQLWLRHLTDTAAGPAAGPATAAPTAAAPASSDPLPNGVPLASPAGEPATAAVADAATADAATAAGDDGAGAFAALGITTSQQQEPHDGGQPLTGSPLPDGVAPTAADEESAGLAVHSEEGAAMNGGMTKVASQDDAIAGSWQVVGSLLE